MIALPAALTIPRFGGMLIIQPVLMDADGGWGKPKVSSSLLDLI